jgi:hypothetical protein
VVEVDKRGAEKVVLRQLITSQVAKKKYCNQKKKDIATRQTLGQRWPQEKILLQKKNLGQLVTEPIARRLLQRGVAAANVQCPSMFTI